MSEDGCLHLWGDVEECETHLGTIRSPVCNHCGAVKLVEESRAADRRRLELATRPVNRPAPLVASNMPPAGSPAVHPFQSEFFTNL